MVKLFTPLPSYGHTQHKDESLLDLCEDRPGKFSDFVKVVLYGVMTGQSGNEMPGSGIDAAELRQILREELGRLLVVFPVNRAEVIEGDEVSDSVRDR